MTYLAAMKILFVTRSKKKKKAFDSLQLCSRSNALNLPNLLKLV